MRVLITILILSLIGCSKKSPETHLLGRWELCKMLDVNNDLNDITSFFLEDIAAFKEITFYENGQFYIAYLNREKKLGNYFINETDIYPKFQHQFYLEHSGFVEDQTSDNFKFHETFFFIKKLTTQTLKIETKNASSKTYDKLEMKFFKTGKFE